MKPRGYWTKERVCEEAAKYDRRGDFSKACGSAYYVAVKHGWLDEIFSGHPNSGYANSDLKYAHWTKDAVFRKAAESNTRTEFSEQCSGAYQAAQRYGWLDECFKSHPNNGFAALTSEK